MATKGGQLGWEIYSNYALPLAVFVPIGYSLWHYEERKRAVYYVTVLTSVVFTMNVSKLWYHQPRPFWVNPAIESSSCSTQYGNPSGHSLVAMAFAGIIWLDYNDTMRDAKRREDEVSGVSADSTMFSRYSDCSCKLWYTRTMFFVVAILFAATVGFSRIVLGVHSINQVTFGLQLGVWLACTSHFCIKDRLFANFDRLVGDPSTSSVEGEPEKGEE